MLYWACHAGRTDEFVTAGSGVSGGLVSWSLAADGCQFSLLGSVIQIVCNEAAFSVFQISVRVTTMDAELEFAIQPNTTGKQLFDQVSGGAAQDLKLMQML